VVDRAHFIMSTEDFTDERLSVGDHRRYNTIQVTFGMFCCSNLLSIICLMTDLLERAIAQLQNAPIDRQDAIATLILEELEAEQAWDASFARSPDLLAQLATEAMAEHHSGKTR
jgi:hypothetical protein